MTPSPPSRPPQGRLLLRIFRGWRIALARLIGISGETRAAGVRGMIERHGKDRVAYWFQLVLSMGIATYGLVLGSTGVVIGAMLVSPLMGPIIEVGMGLVTGSPVLVLHAGARTLASIAVVVAGSALLTLGVPYHELNGEILARTSPTLIDLYVASFCALAAAYTNVRQSSDTISAAAGTAISIALVPPLCVIGWGFGSAHLEVSRGAAMLFTANISAIVLFAVIAFFLLAYDTVDAEALEREAAGEGALLHRLASRLRHGFGSRYGPLLRLGMPLVLAVVIYVPLRHALEEVAWKVRVRDAVERALNENVSAKRAVRTSVNVDRNAVSVRLVVVGDSKAAAKLKGELAARITATAGVSPTVDVIAVPDIEALRAATQVSPTPIVAPSVPAIREVRRDLDEEIRRWWPTATAGELASWSLRVPNDGVVTVQVNHFGAPLGASGESLLASALRERLGADVSVRDVALATESIELRPTEEKVWLTRLAHLVDGLVRSDLGYLCISEPAPSKSKDRQSEVAEVLRSALAAEIERLPPERRTTTTAEVFAARLSATPCPRRDGDAGVRDASADQ